ncbi:hypothetical protein G6F46_007291 [Rhizopus delemar]|uniref:Small ribosomal subunit protein uS2 n=3 Tax=Rhizopus TaxID=4842 RepID=I1C0Z0_RHIO9|nr:hypothetical protein RO3G_06825 [Rhizopus delemar RA 99-880]KAG1457455.1 hypothetical protein G6F55_005920 [Rhizopus delemar]KAG1542659.1 hypothetical protein G6F51_007141 [Rhizopus arrhizus]KAG1496247.1 hypothetical protein G6F54_006609 [Rhizopus delemar]KAG1510024.1 hypothetical protein G6F53_006996 [Rhizopus delemar]|eukprot:EIE82120.1 hypothetical protein RO3G_06825 [Rhizopus delemar RA 99-880]
MSKVPAILNPTEEDIQLLLTAGAHIGTKNLNNHMKPYVFKRRVDGIHLINLSKTWEKLMLAARVVATMKNPEDIVIVSSYPYGRRAALKFAKYIGAEAIVGRFTPGTFTNYITRTFHEPCLVICTDPHSDFQAILEASYVNVPVVSLADTDTSLHYVDVAIPTNNKSIHAIGLAYWLLARAVLRLRGSLDYKTPWDVMVDMFFYRESEEVEKENEVAEFVGEFNSAQWDSTTEEQDWTIEAEGSASFATNAADWSTEDAFTTASDWADDAIPSVTQSGWF